MALQTMAGVDHVVAVDQNIAERDDAAVVSDTCRSAGVVLFQTAQGFPR
jgi:hypothetical protein